MKLDVARATPTSATDGEPSRAFLQERIGLWAFWVFALSSGFYLTNLVTSPFVAAESAAARRHTSLEVGNLDHLAASLVFGGVWVLTRRARLSVSALRAARPRRPHRRDVRSSR